MAQHESDIALSSSSLLSANAIVSRPVVTEFSLKVDHVSSQMIGTLHLPTYILVKFSLEILE